MSSAENVKLYNYSSGDDELPSSLKNLSEFALNVLSLLHSNAVNFLKTRIRNKLTIPTVNGIILSKQGLQKNCTAFEPSVRELAN